MGNRTVGIVMLLFGIVIVGVSAAADPLGLGAGNVVFGPRQIVGVAIGALVIIVGLILLLKKK